MTKEEFVNKYHSELMGRILRGLAADHQNALLGDYAKHVDKASASLLGTIYDDLRTTTKGPKNEQNGNNSVPASRNNQAAAPARG